MIPLGIVTLNPIECGREQGLIQRVKCEMQGN